MNLLEHMKTVAETLDEIYFGEVIKNNDPENLGRVKVRVLGVFDSPIKKSDIPWAIPVNANEIPVLGETVSVFFRQGDLYRPAYFKSTLIEKEKVQAKKDLYQKILDLKAAEVPSSVTVNGSKTVNLPTLDTDNGIEYSKRVYIFPEDVAVETNEGVNVGTPSKGLMVEKSVKNGAEKYSVYHPKGSFVEFDKDGNVIVRSEGKTVLLSKGDVLIKSDSSVSIAGDLYVSNKSVPPGSGPLCAISNCIFSGAPHGGDKAV